jgi:hypothetical protein
MIRPTAAAFGPDGNMYFATYDSAEVFRYNGVTGALWISLYRPAAAVWSTLSIWPSTARKPVSHGRPHTSRAL